MNYAIILASGKGKRALGDIPKQFIKINGKTILEYTIEKFEKNKNTDRIILVLLDEYIDFYKKLNFKKVYKIVRGGSERQDSSYIGVNCVDEPDAKILIHDGARPFVSDDLINRCYRALDKYDAINTGIETTDTIIQINENNIIDDIPPRKNLLRCQTPQGFNSKIIKKAHRLAVLNKIKATDDTGLVNAFKLCDIFVIKGEIENIKITYMEDIEYAKKILGH